MILLVQPRCGITIAVWPLAANNRPQEFNLETNLVIALPFFSLSETLLTSPSPFPVFPDLALPRLRI